MNHHSPLTLLRSGPLRPTEDEPVADPALAPEMNHHSPLTLLRSGPLRPREEDDAA